MFLAHIQGKKKILIFSSNFFLFLKITKLILKADKTINSHDPTISNGNFRAELGIVCVALQDDFLNGKISELVIQNELDKGDILARDGSLQTAITGESNYSKGISSREIKVSFFVVLQKGQNLHVKGKSLVYAIKF